jgi:hypothetical protein
VGSPVGRWVRLFLSTVVCTTHPLDEMCLELQLVYLALYSPSAMNRRQKVIEEDF